MRLSTLADPNTPFEWNGLKLVYNKALWTPRMVGKYLDLESKSPADQLAANVEVLSLILVSWELTDDQDRPIPTTPEGLQDVPLTVLGPLVEAIMADAQPSSEEGNGSSDTSSTPNTSSTSTPESHPNGPEPSQSLEPSASPSLT